MLDAMSEICRPDGNLKFLILCDHASNYIPEHYQGLGVSAESLKSHIAYDIGAAEIARNLSERLGCPAILSRFSRLLIDPNRGQDDPTLVMKLSDGEIIPGNRDVDRFRNSDELELRLARFYRPYDLAISTAIDKAQAAGEVPIILSVHSFTPIWKGQTRPWEGAILWDQDPRLRDHMIRYFAAQPDICFGDNEPYSGRLKNDCMNRHATSRGLPHGLIEIRQDIASSAERREIWVNYLSQIMQNAALDEQCAACNRQ